ncbi:MAG: hypothetical protein R3A52_18105 [Polyangiales bacterium]
MKRCLVALLALAAGGCIEDLDPEAIVRGPRLLDMIAEPPEINPGGSTTLRAVLGRTTGSASYRWITCVPPDQTRGASAVSDFGGGGTNDECFGEGVVTRPLGDGPTATLSVPRNTIDVDALAARFGDVAPRALLERFATEVGIVVGVGVIIEVDGVTLRGYKRVVVSLNPRPNQNPPPPRLRVGGTQVVAVAGEDRCEAEGGGPVRLRRGVEVPLVPDPDESWAERYTVLDATGQFEARDERIFYSWFFTAGNFGRGLTRSPIRDNVWVTPTIPGPHAMWVFVRDGHGGSSGCRVDVSFD